MLLMNFVLLIYCHHNLYAKIWAIYVLSFFSVRDLKDKAMANKCLHIPNDDTQDFFIL